MIPFELYSITPDVDDYGHIFRIPNYYTPSELDFLQSRIPTTPISPEVYPSCRVNLPRPNHTPSKFIGEKTQWFLDNWDKVCELTHIEGVDKRFYHDNPPTYTDESLRGSPPNSKLYPMHTDKGSKKLLTILVPMSDMGNPTMFHGASRSRVWCHEWAVNDAYMFRPSDRSVHSYQNNMDVNRWIMNVNVCGTVGWMEKSN
jgi:hypothetical protein